MALKKHDEKILGWRRAGDTAELVPTSDRFDPKSSWAIIDGLESILWAYTWAGYGDDATTQEFVSPFIQFVRQRPTQLPAVKSLYDVAAWELCLLLRSGSSFAEAVADVSQRTGWMRQYIDDFRLNANRSRDSDDEDNRGRPARALLHRFQGDRKPRQLVQQRGARERRTSRDRDRAGSHRDRRRSPSRSRTPLKVQAVASKSEKQACPDYQDGKCTTQGPCPKGFAHRCAKCGKANHGASKCWSR